VRVDVKEQGIEWPRVARPLEVGLGRIFSNFQEKNTGFYSAKNYTCVQKPGPEGLNRLLGAEDVKRKGKGLKI